MNNNELIFYLVLVSTNCVIAYHWAVYGFFELAIQRPPKVLPFFAVLVGIGTVMVGGYMQRAGSLKLEVITEKNMAMALVYLLGPPLLVMILVRLLHIKSGVANYNRARAATQFWAGTGKLKFGQILQEEGEVLRNFPRAIKALEYFDKAIESQKKGTVENVAKSVISTDDQENYYDGYYNSRCPACGFSIKIPGSTEGVEGQCTMCGSMVTAKRIGRNIYVSAFGKLSKRTVLSAQNKKNIATALGEKALLLRMMNRFDEAEQCAAESLKFVDDALSDAPDDVGLCVLKSLTIFRAAEIAHVKGDKIKARNLYQQCLAIDQSIDNTGDSNLVQGLLASL
ncbi:MAG: tetratricopeptide repeat protein [Candidatus Staskawiczbacteria bacterium]|nr:tetratricopeptide repeat protein [Candidatus Staskawiczbacteria bacterium]